jgi:phage terminase large subunit-like protein
LISLIQNSFELFFKNMTGYEVFKYQKFLISEINREIINSDSHDKRLLLSVPPGYGKSMLATQLLTAFLIGRAKEPLKICICSYSHTIANNQGKLARDFIASPVFKAIFPDVTITSEGESGSFTTSNNCQVYCVGRGGSITSLRFDIIIGDDLLKNSEEAQSEKILSKLKPWLFSTLLSRFYRGKATTFVLIATRWCDRDAHALYEEAYPGVKSINLPALAEDDDSLGRATGEPLEPKMQSLEDIYAIRRADPKTFGALYQGNPKNAEATVLNQALLNYRCEPEGRFKTLIVMDTASTSSATADFTAVITARVYSEYAVIMSIELHRVEFPELVRIVEGLKADAIAVESAASGLQLLQTLPDLLALKVFRGEDKENEGEMLKYNLGKSLFFSDAALADYRVCDQLLSFPFGRHDDAALALLHLNRLLRQEITWRNRSSNLSVLSKYSNKSFAIKKPGSKSRF